jgi:hypothetical protein
MLVAMVPWLLLKLFLVCRSDALSNDMGLCHNEAAQALHHYD